MLEKANRIIVILRNRQNGVELSEQENAELTEWLNESPENQKLFDSIIDKDALNRLVIDYYAKIEKAEGFAEKGLRDSLQGQVVTLKDSASNRKINWRRWIAAACVLGIIASGSFFLFFNKSFQGRIVKTKAKLPSRNDVAPGQYKAKLILGDGSSIVLDSAGLGLLAKQGNANIINKEGSVSYDAGGSNSKEIIYNTLQTAARESYAITLADGTKVWLNAQSSLRFPVAFSGDERSVEIHGEVYFEVAKDAQKPFKVKVIKSSGQACEVEVLGTHFNINDYDDEPSVRTTLLEGSVAISKTGDKKVISPGQQAIVEDNTAIRVKDNVNTYQYTAWKDQRFYFDEEQLPGIMRKLARWYGVQVEYSKPASSDTYTGVIGQNTKLSDVLNILERSGLHFSIEGNKVTVIPD